MTEPNIPLLRKMVEWVEEQEQLPLRTNPDRTWFQGQFLARYSQWACGTSMCVAGKVVLDDGWTPHWDGGKSTDVVTKDGQTATVGAVAKQLLGLSVPQANDLFGYGRSAGDIRRIAESIAGEPL